MSLQNMVSEVVCMKGHPSLVQPLSSNLHGILLGSVFFLGFDEEDDFLAEDGFVAVSTIMTSRLLDTVGVSSVTCLRLVRMLEVFGVVGLGCSKDSVGAPQLKVTVGVLGCFLSLGVYTVSAPEALLLVVTVFAMAFGVRRSLILELSMFRKILNSSTLSAILSQSCLQKNLSSSALFWNYATGNAKNMR